MTASTPPSPSKTVGVPIQNMADLTARQKAFVGTAVSLFCTALIFAAIFGVLSIWVSWAGTAALWCLGAAGAYHAGMLIHSGVGTLIDRRVVSEAAVRSEIMSAYVAEIMAADEDLPLATIAAGSPEGASAVAYLADFRKRLKGDE